MDPTAAALYEVLRRITLYGPDKCGKLHLAIETDNAEARLEADAASATGQALLDWNLMAGVTMAAAELEKGRDPNLGSRHLAPEALKDLDRELREILPPGAHYVAAIVTPDGQLMASASATLKLFKPILQDLFNEPVAETPFSELPDGSKPLH